MSLRRTSARPWVEGRKWPFPTWQERTYGFDTNNGFPAILFEEFIPIKEQNSGRIVAVERKPKSLQNPYGYFVMTYAEVDQTHAEAEKTGETLKVVAGKLFGTRMKPEQFSALALAPDVWSATTDAETVQSSLDVQAKIDAFKKNVAASQTQKKRPQPVEA